MIRKQNRFSARKNTRSVPAWKACFAGSQKDVSTWETIPQGALPSSEIQTRYKTRLCRASGQTKRTPDALAKRSQHVDSARPEGWLPPSIQSKLDHHIRIISRYQAALPKGTGIRIEVGRFDVQHMEDPKIRGEMYQQGPMYEYENLKAYIFARDGYKCQCCKKKAGTKRNDGTTVKLVIASH